MNDVMQTHWLFFDLDGTLADSLPGLHASIAEALHRGGRVLRVDDLKPYIGPGIRTIFKNLEDDLTESELDEMERCFRASYDASGVRNTLLFEGVKQTLETLKADGAELFLVTNKPKLATANLMEQHGITWLFTEMQSRNSREPAYGSKGEMLLELVERRGVDLARAVMVGDTAEDHHAAVDAGMKFVFAGYGYGELDDAVECIRLTQFAELAQMLKLD
ncbi:MAG: HAD family hydrolase [Acidobacteriaceae bacterium]|nr:HAD family hydrolase [Acidobacteriaceae bacterium]